MAKGKGKGSQFERDFSRDLSLWWSKGKRKDLFWRSAMSGGMSTVTGCQAQAGDIIAVDEQGYELIDAICFELKCGYNHCQVNDLLDGSGTKQIIKSFVEQANESHERANTDTYSIVLKRDRKKPLIFFPLGTLFGSYVVGIDYGIVNAQGVQLEYCRLSDFFKLPPHVVLHIVKDETSKLTAADVFSMSLIKS